MPRHVDPEARRREIVDAALAVLGERGLDGFSLRVVAERMGGSVTLVTHYYDSRQALLDDTAVRLVDWWEGELKEQEHDVEDPRLRLALLLDWLLPTTPTDRLQARARFHLLDAGTKEPVETSHLFHTWEAYVRRLLREHLADLLPADRIEPAVDLLRAVTNGLTVAAIEEASDTSTANMRAVLATALAGLGIDDVPLDEAASQPSSHRPSA